MNEETIDQGQLNTATKRPTFLTVLCILTFIVSGWNFISSLIGIFASKSFDEAEWQQATESIGQAMGEADDQTRKVMENFMEAATATIEAGIEHATAIGLVEMLGALLGILGAFMMFRLKITGYYVYIAAKIVVVFVPLFFLGFNILTGIVYGIAALVSIVFIILYGLNRKYLS